ncbi:hypothetical protein [Rathayibacter sp. VKM Ac-2760]|uniref:hypothetical protein n=1 Tax=Rathayibacter sp. VKM Ac-2760 TaxID=2609253 RepID=UPI0013189E4B|nr:hypothetical protein [Rathayibacter sp. VKM Ac-2760]QHC57727.1 hypothetical protein GSU72_03410 [Rathayibacter sp. VKM Ac-2760]
MADSTRTDPRHHAAYQRGYQGPAPEARDRDEASFRRPRRAGGRAVRAEAELPSAALEPAEPADEAPSGSAEPVDTPRPDVPAARRPIDRRVPITLAVAGVVLVPIGLAALWWSTLASYTTTVVYERLEPEQYLWMLLGFAAAPALTIGLIALAAAVVLQAVRRSRG